MLIKPVGFKYFKTEEYLLTACIKVKTIKTYDKADFPD